MATTKMCAWHTGIMGHTSYKTTIYNDHRIALNFRVHCSALSTDPLHHPHSQQGAFKFSPAPPPGRPALMGGGGAKRLSNRSGLLQFCPPTGMLADQLLAFCCCFCPQKNLLNPGRARLRAWHCAFRTMVQRPRCFVCVPIPSSQRPHPFITTHSFSESLRPVKMLTALTLASVQRDNEMYIVQQEVHCKSCEWHC